MIRFVGLWLIAVQLLVSHSILGIASSGSTQLLQKVKGIFSADRSGFFAQKSKDDASTLITTDTQELERVLRCREDELFLTRKHLSVSSQKLKATVRENSKYRKTLKAQETKTLALEESEKRLQGILRMYEFRIKQLLQEKEEEKNRSTRATAVQLSSRTERKAPGEEREKRKKRIECRSAEDIIDTSTSSISPGTDAASQSKTTTSNVVDSDAVIKTAKRRKDDLAKSKAATAAPAATTATTAPTGGSSSSSSSGGSATPISATHKLYL